MSETFNMGGGWNYRAVIEREPDLVDKGAYVESFSFRDVYYDKSGKAKSWGAEPQHAAGETLEDLLRDLELMADGLQKDIIIIQNDEIVDMRPWTAAEAGLIKKFFAPKIPTEKRDLAQDAIDEIKTASEVKTQFQKMMEEVQSQKINVTGGSYTQSEQDYLIEQKKRDLQHEIEKARRSGSADMEKSLIHAYDKFRKDVEQQKQKERSDFEKYPF